jgi:hypothetical protein
MGSRSGFDQGTTRASRVVASSFRRGLSPSDGTRNQHANAARPFRMGFHSKKEHFANLVCFSYAKAR